jgi:uncharacterized cofD-like protein
MSSNFLQSLARRSLWLVYGMGVKRWLVVLSLGAAATGMGLVYLLIMVRNGGWLPDRLYYLLTLQFLPLWGRVILPLVVGGVIIATALVRLGTNLVAPFRRPGEDVVESLYQYTQRNRGPDIVAIGGGTGLPSLLRGLKDYTGNITAIVTVADDGGSSGRLRQELGLIPPGDFRNNIAALARDEALMTQLLQYRFGGNVAHGAAQGAAQGSAQGVAAGVGQNGRGELQGHAFGNLLLAALTGITGSFDEALLAAERVLAMWGRVLPSTLEQVTLVAEVLVGEVVQRVAGESFIPEAGGEIKRVALEPAGARAYPPAVQAILRADLVVIGPGSLYTSILPNLLVGDLAEALRHTRAPRVYVCNLATQPGETDNYTVADHAAEVIRYLPPDSLDVVLANDNLSVPADRGGGETVFVRPVAPEKVRLVTADLVDEQRPWRHDSAKLAKAVIELLESVDGRRKV